MTKDEANALLDRAAAGEDISPSQITRALRVTGDVSADRAVQVTCPCGQWEMTGAGGLYPADPFDGLFH